MDEQSRMALAAIESRESKPQTPALCITGMHRSGTSLVSSMLQAGGLDIGQRLLGPGTGNIKGHFEDLDFCHFHIWVLESQGLHNSGFILQSEIQIRPQHLHRAQELVEERRRRSTPWGWKDPRSTLFLDFWAKLLPDAHFLFLYRAPWDVVDSLFRRGDAIFCANPDLAVLVWTHYNRLLLRFCDRFPERCLFVNCYQAARSPSLLPEALQRKFGLKLGPIADLYDASLLHRLGSGQWGSFIQHFFPEAVEVYQMVNARAAEDCGASSVSLAAEEEILDPSKDWACQDWFDLRALELRHREMQRNLEQELQRTREALDQTRLELNSTQEAFQQLVTIREELQQERSRLAQAKEGQLQALTQLEQTQEVILSMESSKFWKLRQAWFAVKRGLRRTG